MQLKKTNTSKIFSLLLVLLMVLSIFPTTVFAATPALPSLSIAGTKVTAANQQDILGDGTCSFSYDEAASQWVLALNNATLTCSGSTTGIFLDGFKDNFVIQLTGENTITTVSRSAISVRMSDLTIRGAGSLAVSCSDAIGIEVTSGNSSGTTFGGNLTISENASVTASAPYIGISATIGMKVDHANLTVNTTKDNNYGIYANKYCEISNSTVNVTVAGEGNNAINSQGSMTIIGSNLTCSSGYPALYAASGISLTDTTVDATSREGCAIYSNQNLTVSGGNVKATAYYCGLLAKGTMDISNHATVKATSADNDDAAIFANGAITVSDSDVTGSGWAGIKGTSTITAADSTLNLTSTTGKGIDSAGATSLTGCALNVTAPWGAIGSDNITTATLTNCTGTMTSDKSACIFSKGLTIDGSKTDLAIAGKSRGIYCEGDLTFNGGTVNLSATNGDAVDVYNGTLNYVGGNMNATAPVVAYTFSSAAEQPMQTPDLITVNSNYAEQGGAKIASTGWFNQGGTWALKNAFVSSETDTLAQDMSNASKAVNVAMKSADYSAVDAVLAQIPVDLSVYTDASVKVLKDATDAVIRGKGITEQAAVNSYVAPIEQAISALVLKDADYSAVDAAIAKIPADLSGYTDASVKALNAAKNAVVRGKDITEQAAVDAYAAAIEQAISVLALKDADYSAVDAAIAKIPADLSGYTDASVKALNAAKNAVVRGKDITEQAAVDAYAAAIEQAVTGLEKNAATPQTSDAGNVALWLSLLFVSGGILIATTFVTKRAKHNHQ